MVEYRTMLIDDYDNVYNLWNNTPGIGLNEKDDSREGIEKYLKRNPNTCFVATLNSEIIGAIMAGHDGRRGYIYHMTVKDKHRNKKIGKTLLEKTMNELKNEGINKTALVVFKNNDIEHY